MCMQPLRDSLQVHLRLGSAAAAARLLASIAHPPASDRPGPLEAGHRRARSLILTPIELKVWPSEPHPPVSCPQIDHFPTSAEITSNVVGQKSRVVLREFEEFDGLCRASAPFALCHRPLLQPTPVKLQVSTIRTQI